MHRHRLVDVGVHVVDIHGVQVFTDLELLFLNMLHEVLARAARLHPHGRREDVPGVFVRVVEAVHHLHILLLNPGTHSIFDERLCNYKTKQKSFLVRLVT